MNTFKEWLGYTKKDSDSIVVSNFASFNEWLLHESTVSQILRQKTKSTPRIKIALKDAKNYFESRLDGIDFESANMLAKWYVWRYLKEFKGDPLQNFIPWLQAAFANHRDFISSNIDESGSIIKIKSNLNNPKYSLGNLGDDIDLWHEKLEAEAGSMPAEGDVFIDLGEELGDGWKGWNWVDLGTGYCSREARAMGHCGNSGAKPDDNILSLRDPKGRAHLTFILNNGNLGEMKGRSNTKPKKAFHPAIVALLRHDDIESVIGGGYRPENNFSLYDLDPETREKLAEEKPDLEMGVERKLEQIEEKLEEIKQEYWPKWSFCHADATAEDNGNGEIYIHIHGGWYLDLSDLKIDLPPGLPGRWNSESRNELQELIDNYLKPLQIGDATIDDNYIRGDIEHDWDGNSYDDPEQFDDYCSYLDRDIEPKGEAAIQRVKVALMELGYLPPSYTSQVLGYGDENNDAWDESEFENFSWEEPIHSDRNSDYAPHMIRVLMDQPIVVGNKKGLEGFNLDGFIWGDKRAGRYWVKSDQKNWSPLFQDFIQTMQLKLYEIAQQQAALAKTQMYLPGFEKPAPKQSFSADLKIKPLVNIKNYSGDDFVMNVEFLFTVEDSKEDILEAKAFVSFLDKNFNRFTQIAQQTFRTKAMQYLYQQEELSKKWKQENPDSFFAF